MDGEQLILKRLGINTYKEAIIYMREDCHICRAEGFEAQARIMVQLGNRTIIATLNTVNSELLGPSEVSLSNSAWDLLTATEGAAVTLFHAPPPKSLSYIRAKAYGNILSYHKYANIVQDIVSGSLSDVHISAFLTACSGNRLDKTEITSLTKAMLQVGQHLSWPSLQVVDKHCVGGLPGNRTSLIIVPIVASAGLIMPKTSSRSITSPAGTADTMEVFAPVDLDLSAMRKVVEKENGCIIWGSKVNISPADEILIRIEHAIDFDSEGQLVASVLSKKIAAGSNYILIDIPVGNTAKIRTIKTANLVKESLEITAASLGVNVRVTFTDGSQPVGRGIGPALEARDVIAVLQNDLTAPQDLRDRALTLAGQILEFSSNVKPGNGKILAETILNSGQAWKKFQDICNAQGGMRQIPTAKFSQPIFAETSGKVISIDNRRLAKLAKLAGAPEAKTAGIELLTPLNSTVDKGDVLFTLYAETRGELQYALTFLRQELNIIQIEG